jgi:hypothetical protein
MKSSGPGRLATIRSRARTPSDVYQHDVGQLLRIQAAF